MACPHQHQTAPPPRPVPSANRTAPPCPPALPPETRRSARSRTPAVSSKFSSHPEGPAPPLNQASPVGHPAQQPSRPALPLPLAPQHVPSRPLPQTTPAHPRSPFAPTENPSASAVANRAPREAAADAAPAPQAQPYPTGQSAEDHPPAPCRCRLAPHPPHGASAAPHPAPPHQSASKSASASLRKPAEPASHPQTAPPSA